MYVSVAILERDGRVCLSVRILTCDERSTVPVAVSLFVRDRWESVERRTYDDAASMLRAEFFTQSLCVRILFCDADEP